MLAEQLRWYNRRLSAAVPGETGDLVIQFRAECPDHRSVSAGTGDCESFLAGAPRLTQGQTPSQAVLEPRDRPPDCRYTPAVKEHFQILARSFSKWDGAFGTRRESRIVSELANRHTNSVPGFLTVRCRKSVRGSRRLPRVFVQQAA